MLFSCGKSADSIYQLLTRQQQRPFNCLADNQLRQNRTTDQRRRTAVSQEARRFNNSFAHAQRQVQAIAADRISFFADGVRVGDLAGVARVCDVIFEGF